MSARARRRPHHSRSCAWHAWASTRALKGHGIGRGLLRHVLALALEQRDRLGCVGVVTDAKPEAVAFYEALGFMWIHCVRGGLLHDEPTPMFLAIDAFDTIASAVER